MLNSLCKTETEREKVMNEYLVRYNFEGDDDLIREVIFESLETDIDTVRCEFYDTKSEDCRVFSIEVL